MKLVFAATAFALTAVSAAYAGQDYAADTIATRSVPAAPYLDTRDRGLYPSGILTLTVGQETVVPASEYLQGRDRGQNDGDTVTVYTFGALSDLEPGSVR